MAFAALKDRAQRLNQRLAGHRFLFDTVSLAGSSLRIGETDARSARAELAKLDDEQRALWRELRFAASLQARLGGVGQLAKHDAIRLGAAGPAARAAGMRRDTRSESPRLSYDEFAPAIPERAAGDVAARLDVRALELARASRSSTSCSPGTCSPGA